MSKLPAAIIYDWDNTLIDTFPLLKEAYNLTRRTMGLPEWNDAQARAGIRMAAKDSFPKIFGSRAPEAMDLYLNHIRAHHLARMDVIDGAADLLKFLSGKGVKQGVLSNKRREFLRAEIAQLGWQDHFLAVTGADDVKGPAKPSPEGLLATIEQMNLAAVPKDSIWYAGDTENDLKTAKAANVIPVFIENHSMSDPDQIKALGPAHSFKNPRECLDYLAGLA